MKKIWCIIFGHKSTGDMLWWMCDRCHSDFERKAIKLGCIGENKVTVSKGILNGMPVDVKELLRKAK